MARNELEPNPDSRRAKASVFRCTGDVVLRAPLLARGRVRDTWQAPSSPSTQAGAGAPDAVRAYLATLATDERFLEAVEVSSATLSRLLDRLLAGDEVLLPDQHKAARALTRYWLRATTRPTPFGLMAGVMWAEFGDHSIGELRGGGFKGVRPDRGQLARLVARWEQDPFIFDRLHVTANDLCFVRGDRLVLPVAPNSSEIESSGESTEKHHVPLSRTLRFTPVVRAALQEAWRPVRLGALEAQIEKGFPGAPAGAVRKLLTQLVAADVLLTELRPPFDVSDPLQYLLERLPEGMDSPVREQVRAMQRALDSYREAPLGAGRAAWRAASAAAGGSGSLQVDLRLDGNVVLPRAVARELERAADVLWRLSPRSTSYLAPYHQEFLERYGVGRRVPLKELLDPDIGLGAPAGYRMPLSHRLAPRPEPRDAVRERELHRLAMEALVRGKREVTLDDALVDRLAGGARAGRDVPPPSLELIVHVVAESTGALDRGDFTLVMSPNPGSPQAGATIGRFAYFLPESARLRDTLRSIPSSRPSALPAQLHYQVAANRLANVAQVPTWLEHRILVGTYCDREDPYTISLDDIAVGADPERFILVSSSLGCELDPIVLHMLNQEIGAPNAARFLIEAPSFGQTRWSPWDWGTAAHAPFLPAIRLGRTVLSSARWRLDDPALLRPAKDIGRWDEAFVDWRERWRVPNHVQVLVADQRIPLNLDVPAHRDIVRYEAVKRGAITFQEPPTQDVDGWLRGPGGAHEAEIVVALAAAARGAVPKSPSRPMPRARPRLAVNVGRGEVHEHPPGGAWLYARLDSSAERHDELLTRWLTPLFAAADASAEAQEHASVDRWFFIRYQDPDPHLRLGFHGRPEALNGRLLPRLHELTKELRASGLAHGLRLDSYLPETERYGGPRMLPFAEEIFCADSRLVIERLRTSGSDALLDTACDVVEFVRAFHAGYEVPWHAWLTATYPKQHVHHLAFVERRRTALERISLGSLECGPDEGHERANRESALGRMQSLMEGFGRRLREGAKADSSDIDASDILSSLLHMHCNRRLGVDLKAEAQVMAIARGAVQGHLDRLRVRSCL